jgi:hypothetical protein
LLMDADAADPSIFGRSTQHAARQHFLALVLVGCSGNTDGPVALQAPVPAKLPARRAARDEAHGQRASSVPLGVRSR